MKNAESKQHRYWGVYRGYYGDDLLYSFLAASKFRIQFYFEVVVQVSPFLVDAAL